MPRDADMSGEKTQYVIFILLLLLPILSEFALIQPLIFYFQR
ncbi:hypothetical protein HMPREF0454_01821 [Hafnia alvei ATCC 51873]|uniref:Uncharacterized protein n=1 Tax=Hafnia alvei ATCC 51873 TaxID=1002364 RepID=G9Y5L2_HAFAL|nr:hypothetical protein HMPREF0454_01821 [Hafnia alvei ATCC 51873]